MNQPWGDFEKNSKTDLESLIRHMVRVSGKSGSQISREMGRTSNFLWSTLQNKSVPRIDLFVNIATRCGFNVVVQNDGEEYWLLPDSDGTVMVGSVRDANDILHEIIGSMDDEKRIDAGEVIDTFCTGYDIDRLRTLDVADLQKDSSGYLFIDSSGKAVARCCFDAFSGEPQTLFLDQLEQATGETD